VLAILVILAGLVVGKLDLLDMKANKGVAASNIVGVARYIQMYRINTTTYPDGWDSLLSGTALWAPGAPGGAAGLDPQLTGGPPTGSPVKLTTTTLTEDATTHHIRSLARLGITTVYDLDATSGDVPGSRFTVARTLADGATVATINVADGDGLNIVRNIYPASPPVTGVPAGKKLVVVGLGPLNKLIGNTNQALLMDAPFYANTNQAQYYNRFLAVFEISDSGSRAKLVAVLGADGDRSSEEIADFYEQ
jgi:hypothetical protein